MTSFLKYMKSSPLKCLTTRLNVRQTYSYLSKRFYNDIISDNNVNHKPIERIVINGKPYERGMSYGLQVKDKLIANVEYYKNYYKHFNWDRVHELVDRHYMKALAKYYPKGIEEMRGMAVSAGCNLEDIVALNARYELAVMNFYKKKDRDQKPGGAMMCASAICMSEATKTGDVLMGFNWDNESDILDNDMQCIVEVHPDQSENIAPYIMLAEIGMLGGFGMNGQGLGQIILGLRSSADIFLPQNDTPYMPVNIIRRLIIEAPTFSMAVKRMISTPKHISFVLLLASDENLGVIIEVTPNGYYIAEPSLETPFMTHANRFTSEAFFADNTVKDTFNSFDSVVKDQRMRRRLYHEYKHGQLDMDSFAHMFTDHGGYPDSVCAHLPPGGRRDLATFPTYRTVGNIIMNLTQRNVSICRGNPCIGLYEDYFVPGSSR